MSDFDFTRLKPSLFLAPGLPEAKKLLIDDVCRASFTNYRRHVRDLDQSKYKGPFDTERFLSRFDESAFYILSLLQTLKGDLSTMSVLDIGCGSGFIGLGIAAGVRKYIGIEIDQELIDNAILLHDAAGTTNCAFHLMNAEAVMDSLPKLGLSSPPDIIMMVGALEHHTPAERAQLFDYIRLYIEQGGLFFLASVPNRLMPYDNHSSDLHFSQMLPDHIAAIYHKIYSKRHYTAFNDDPFKGMDWGPRDLRCSDPGVSEKLYRYGRSLSYHDFDLYFHGMSGVQIMLDGWEPLRLNLQPVIRSEVELEKYLSVNCPEVNHAFSRAWFDAGFGLGKDWGEARGDRVRFTPCQMLGPVIRYDRPFWYSLDNYYMPNTTASLQFLFASAPAFIVLLIDGNVDDQIFDVIVNGLVHTTIDLETFINARPPGWQKIFAIPVLTPGDTSEVIVRPQSGHSCNCQGLLAY